MPSPTLPWANQTHPNTVGFHKTGVVSDHPSHTLRDLTHCDGSYVDEELPCLPAQHEDFCCELPRACASGRNVHGEAIAPTSVLLGSKFDFTAGQRKAVEVENDLIFYPRKVLV